MSSNPYLAYVESKVDSASPLQLVHLAYEAAIEAICQARVHLAAKQIQERSKRITRAQLIVRELQLGLDFERGGELAKTLAGLYSYIQTCLIEGNFRQRDERLAEAQSLLETVAQSWKQLSGSDASAATPCHTAPSLASPWSSGMPVTASALSYSL